MQMSKNVNNDVNMNPLITPRAKRLLLSFGTKPLNSVS